MANEPTETQWQGSNFTLTDPLHANSIQFYNGNTTPILTITKDGKVFGNPDIEADEAAHQILSILEQMTGIPLDERKRVQDLLEANNRYLNRARKSEQLLAKAVGCMMLVCEDDIKLHEEIKTHLRAPWLTSGS